MSKRPFKFGPALIGSIALHAGLIALLVFEFPREARQLVLSAVPVEVISDTQHEAAPAPPAPETTPQPPSPPQPTPPQPQPPPPKPEPSLKPQPSKPQAKPQPPTPPQKSFDTSNLFSDNRTDNSRRNPNPGRAQPAQGHDEVSTGPDVDALRGMFGRIWSPNCPASGSNNVQIGVRIRLRFDGSTLGPAMIENPRPNDSVWVAAADRAAIAAKALRYRDLTPQQLRTLADRGEIYFKIDQRTACRL